MGKVLVPEMRETVSHVCRCHEVEYNTFGVLNGVYNQDTYKLSERKMSLKKKSCINYFHDWVRGKKIEIILLQVIDFVLESCEE